MTNETPPPSQHREPIEADREGVTPSDREWADKVIAVEHPNNHEAFEYAVAEVIRDHRLAFSTPAASDGEAGRAQIVADAKDALAQLANTPMSLPLSDWGNVAFKLMRAIEAARALPLPKAGEATDGE